MAPSVDEFMQPSTQAAYTHLYEIGVRCYHQELYITALHLFLQYLTQKSPAHEIEARLLFIDCALKSVENEKEFQTEHLQSIVEPHRQRLLSCLHPRREFHFYFQFSRLDCYYLFLIKDKNASLDRLMTTRQQLLDQEEYFLYYEFSLLQFKLWNESKILDQALNLAQQQQHESVLQWIQMIKLKKALELGNLSEMEPELTALSSKLEKMHSECQVYFQLVSILYQCQRHDFSQAYSSVLALQKQIESLPLTSDHSRGRFVLPDTQLTLQWLSRSQLYVFVYALTGWCRKLELPSQAKKYFDASMQLLFQESPIVFPIDWMNAMSMIVARDQLDCLLLTNQWKEAKQVLYWIMFQLKMNPSDHAASLAYLRWAAWAQSTHQWTLATQWTCLSQAVAVQPRVQEVALLTLSLLGHDTVTNNTNTNSSSLTTATHCLIQAYQHLQLSEIRKAKVCLYECLKLAHAPLLHTLLKGLSLAALGHLYVASDPTQAKTLLDSAFSVAKKCKWDTCLCRVLFLKNRLGEDTLGAALELEQQLMASQKEL